MDFSVCVCEWDILEESLSLLWVDTSVIQSCLCLWVRLYLEIFIITVGGYVCESDLLDKSELLLWVDKSVSQSCFAEN